MLKWVELCPETKIFGMLQGDGDDSAALCQCDKCRAFGASVTDRQLRFVNIVAKAVGKKYPDKLIATWAYCMTLDAPVNVVPEPNVPVYIGVCDSPWGKNGSFTETRIDAPSCTRGVSMFSNWLRTGVPLGTALYFPSTYEAVIILSFVTPFYSLCHCEERVYERRGNPRINLFYFGLLRLLKKPRNDMVCIFYFYFYNFANNF